MSRYAITAVLAALAVVAAGCSDGDTSAPGPTGAPPTTVTAAPTTTAPTTTQPSGTGTGATRPTTPPAPTGVPYDPDVSCTNRVNYVGDPRSNAEINSIGERTGTCPAPQR